MCDPEKMYNSLAGKKKENIKTEKGRKNRNDLHYSKVHAYGIIVKKNRMKNEMVGIYLVVSLINCVLAIFIKYF